MKTSRILFAVAVGLHATCGVGAQEYKIQMQRPAKEGQRFEITFRLQETQRISASLAGRSTPEYKTNFVAELDGLIEVLEVGAKGSIAKASCTISNCVRLDGPDRWELLPNQAVVLASAEKEKIRYQINGKALDAQAQRVVAIGMPLHSADSTTDEVFGTDRPKKVGESWDVNPEYLAWLLRGQDLGISPRDIEGRTTLEQTVKVGEVDCLELASKVYLKKYTPRLPPDVQVKQTFGALRRTEKLPRETSLAALEETMDFDGTFIAQVASGPRPGVTTKTIWTYKYTLQRKYLK